MPLEGRIFWLFSLALWQRNHHSGTKSCRDLNKLWLICYYTAQKRRAEPVPFKFWRTELFSPANKTPYWWAKLREVFWQSRCSLQRQICELSQFLHFYIWLPLQPFGRKKVHGYLYVENQAQKFYLEHWAKSLVELVLVNPWLCGWWYATLCKNMLVLQ